MRIGAVTIIIIVVSIIAVALLGSIGYLFYFKRRAQKALDNNQIKRTNLPAPIVFIITILLVASIFGNIVSIIGFATNKNVENVYSHSAIGKLGSEYQYIKDEVIQGLRPEYDVTSKQSNDFIMYYAKIKDEIKETITYLPHYIVYVQYIGNEEFENDYQMKLTNISGQNKSTVYVSFNSSDSILTFSSHEIKNLKVSAEIKLLVLPEEKEDVDMKRLFEEAGDVLYSFEFEIIDSNFK